MALLEIKDLRGGIEGKEILRGLTLSVDAGEVHAIMGPNGSGKSTLANILAGRPRYAATGGTVSFEGKNLLELSTEERAREGVFLAMQYPVEIPGVNNIYFLKAALNSMRKHSRRRSTRCANIAARKSWMRSSSCSSRGRR
jgi:Fe-S cluster assembly ATP-binding protein